MVECHICESKECGQILISDKGHICGNCVRDLVVKLDRENDRLKARVEEKDNELTFALSQIPLLKERVEELEGALEEASEYLL